MLQTIQIYRIPIDFDTFLAIRLTCKINCNLLSKITPTNLPSDLLKIAILFIITLEMEILRLFVRNHNEAFGIVYREPIIYCLGRKIIYLRVASLQQSTNIRTLETHSEVIRKQ